ncbi:penicillin amidase family protein [Stylonychia lemnae]|uniref:Penicillin amidase family protein n=1 Tax=Stylonychia lemnae TaxID=5949 RepID=A0A078AYU0_STYLE|nr:penicillin amidase family protein [Stylonychia lemnae]|eukprot:CDW85943.1 penicillin amidase family protein [Stylonychia lemnae]
MFKKILGLLLISVFVVLVLDVLLLQWIYKPVTEGTLYLSNAMGEAEVLRETETSIPHVYASSELMAVYTEGFIHAQERLWQMERLRRVAQGELSELFGEKTIAIDTFFRHVGLQKAARESLPNLSPESSLIFQAYADGVNDYLSNVKFPNGQTGKMLPPEYILLGISEVRPWTPIDSLSILKMLNFHLSWNWNQDMMRELLSIIGLEDMVEIIYPFNADYAHNLVTIVGDEDIQGTRFWSDATLSERYHKTRGTQPKLTQAQQNRAEEKARKEEEKLRQEEEKLRLEQERLRQEEEKRLQEEERQKQEEEQKKRQEEERLRQEEEKQRQEEEKKRLELEEKKRLEEEQKRLEEERLRKVKEEQERVQKEKEEQERKRAEEEERQRKEAERKQKEEDERKAKEQETQRQVEEERLRKEAEEKVRLQKEQEENEKKIKEEQERKLKEEEEERRIQEENKKKQEEAKRQEEENERIKQEQLEQERIKKEQEELEEKRKVEEEEKARQQKEAEENERLRKEKEEQERKQREFEELQRKQKEEEELQEKKKQEEEDARIKKEQEEERLRIQKAEEETLRQEQLKLEELQKQQQSQKAEKPAEQDQEAKKEEVLPPQMDQMIHLDESQASNNWVIHGNYTKNGKPLLAGDPHLSNQIPSHWYLMELNYDGKYVIGATHPGIPLVMMGKTNNNAWTTTSALTDLADVYEETISPNKKQYRVDGEWRDLVQREEIIKIQGQDPLKLTISHTHRGPVIPNQVFQGAEVFFGEGNAHLKTDGQYSFAWTGHTPQENTMDNVRNLMNSDNLHDILKNIDDKGYYSVPQNILMADNKGNIGYYLGAMMPKRRNQTPFSGCRVLDGSNSDNDWDGLHDSKDLLRVINPKKGYIVTANNRPAPEHSLFDIGATSTSTIRAQRITELIQAGIDKGNKFDHKDMIHIQNDTVDLMARDLMPHVLRIANNFKSQLNATEQQKAQQAIDKLLFWHGEMHEESVGATIYAVWQFKLYKTLFHKFSDDNEVRLLITSNYPFNDFIQRMIRIIDQEPENSDLNQICEMKDSSYRGKSSCSFNIAKALAEAIDFLTVEISQDPNDWKWMNVHVNEYPNMPWSITPLKFLFHRETPIGGNSNTVKVSKYSMKKLDKLKTFKSWATPNYKTVVEYAEDPFDELMLYSHDGGQSGNLFAGHYHDFQSGHSIGKLLKGFYGKAAVEQIAHQKLYFKKDTEQKLEELSQEQQHHHHSHAHHNHQDHDHSDHSHGHHHDHNDHHHEHAHSHQKTQRKNNNQRKNKADEL